MLEENSKVKDIFRDGFRMMALGSIDKMGYTLVRGYKWLPENRDEVGWGTLSGIDLWLLTHQKHYPPFPLPRERKRKRKRTD